jgi:3-(methylthio)propanoyl-CoA dehydrogenase
MSYTAPAKDMLFVMNELAGIDNIARLPGFEEANLDTAQAVLEASIVSANGDQGVLALSEDQF